DPHRAHAQHRLVARVDQVGGEALGGAHGTAPVGEREHDGGGKQCDEEQDDHGFDQGEAGGAAGRAGNHSQLPMSAASPSPPSAPSAASENTSNGSPSRPGRRYWYGLPHGSSGRRRM